MLSCFYDILNIIHDETTRERTTRFMKHTLYTHVTLLVALLFILNGCGPFPRIDKSLNTHPENFYDKMFNMDPTLRMNREEIRDKLLNRESNKTAETKESLDIPAIPDLSPILAAPTPPKIADGKRISLSVTDDIPLKDVLIELSRLANIDIELDPAISGGVVLRVKDKPIDDVVESIARLANLRYKVVDGVLRIERDLPYSVNYSADFLNLERSNKGGVSISTKVLGSSSSSSSSGGSSSNDSGGSGALSSGSTNSLTSSYNGNLWDSIEQGIENILEQHNNQDEKEQSSSSKKTFSINKQAGLITVFGTSKQHKSVKAYLDHVRRSATSQVLIEAKILEVNLDEEFRTGINWNLLNERSNISVSGAFSQNISGITDLFTINALGKDNISIEAAANLAQTFGVSRTLSSPRLLATNNQQAILTFAENEVYFTTKYEDEAQESNSGAIFSTLNIESEIHTVPIGVIVTLQPSINLDNNEITMNIRPTLTRISRHVVDPGTSLIAQNIGASQLENRIPVVEVREMDSVLKIKSGQVMVLGGLMEERSVNSDSGIPGVSGIPGLGNLFKSSAKTKDVIETVIFIRATILPSYGVEESDQELYKTFSRDPRPLAF